MKKSNKILIIITSLILLIITTISILFIFQDKNEVNIIGFDKYISKMTTSRKNKTNQILYDKIIQHTTQKIGEVIIRDGSYTEKYNSDKLIYTSNFIVDISDLKESYKIEVAWAISDNTELWADNLKITCPLSSELIYGDFNCNQLLGIEEIEIDPIEQYLPYSTFNYTINIRNYKENNKPVLFISIYIFLSDTRTQSLESAVNEYKQKALSWIKSKNIDINNYTVEYQVFD